PTGGTGGTGTGINIIAIPLLPPTVQVTSLGFTDTAVSDHFPASPGNVVATDVNAGATLTFGIVGETPDISLPGFNESATGSFGTLFFNSATGAFTFIPNDA